MRVEQRREPGTSDVLSWRRRQLVDCGFSHALAVRVARDRGYDLHALIELVERGCPPALAVRILAPIEDRPGV